MSIPITDTSYEKLAYERLSTLDERVQALLDGKTIIIREFEKFEGADVVVRLNRDEVRGYALTQISYDIARDKDEKRFWRTFNVGLLDLAVLDVYVVTDNTVFLETNKYKIGDIVEYVSEEGGKDVALIIGIYRSKDPNTPNTYAYQLSREPNFLYKEDVVTPSKGRI